MLLYRLQSDLPQRSGWRVEPDLETRNGILAQGSAVNVVASENQGRKSSKTSRRRSRALGTVSKG